MNPEKLIECVRAYSGLYDLSDRMYSDSVWKEQTWKSIGEELNQPGILKKIIYKYSYNAYIIYYTYCN